MQRIAKPDQVLLDRAVERAALPAERRIEFMRAVEADLMIEGIAGQHETVTFPDTVTFLLFIKIMISGKITAFSQF